RPRPARFRPHPALGVGIRAEIVRRLPVRARHRDRPSAAGEAERGRPLLRIDPRQPSGRLPPRGTSRARSHQPHHQPGAGGLGPAQPGLVRARRLPSGSGLRSFVDYLFALDTEIGRQRQAKQIVVGHSFGSILVSHLAASHPEALPELVLINPITSPALEGSARFLTVLTRAYYSLGARLPERQGRALLSNRLIVRAMSEVMATTSDAGLRRYVHDQHDRHFSSFADRQSLAQAYATSVAHTVTEVAAALTMPVLVIAGDRDSIAPIGP